MASQVDSGELVLRCVADMDTPSPEDAAARESAYRRGYYQGVAAALAAWESRAVSLKQVSQHLYFDLYKWRYHAPTTTTVLPPPLEKE